MSQIICIHFAKSQVKLTKMIIVLKLWEIYKLKFAQNYCLKIYTHKCIEFFIFLLILLFRHLHDLLDWILLRHSDNSLEHMRLGSSVIGRASRPSIIRRKYRALNVFAWLKHIDALHRTNRQDFSLRWGISGTLLQNRKLNQYSCLVFVWSIMTLINLDSRLFKSLLCIIILFKHKVNISE